MQAHILFLSLVSAFSLLAAPKEPLFPENLNVKVPHIDEDDSVSIGYDIVYVRADRAGDEKHKRYYADFSQPVTMEPGADLMLLHPDGSEELLVDGGAGSVTDPFVSFDAEWVYYTLLPDLEKGNQWNPPRQGADIYKIHLKSRKIVRLTDQTFTPNTGAADWASDFRSNEKGKNWYDYGIYHMGPCPLPNGKVVFTSNRDGFKPANGYPAIALQLFIMDDNDDGLGTNIEKIGHMNIGGALHPVVLRDGRIMFSTLESQGIRARILWGVWTIHPDGTNWEPLISAFDPGGAPNGFHFQTQLSDGSIVVEGYYNQNNSGFGILVKLPPPGSFDVGEPRFGPAFMGDPANKPWRIGRFYNAKGRYYRMPFMPRGSENITPFTHLHDGPANPSVFDDKESPALGKFSHPSGAPDNHLLVTYSPGPANHQYTYLPQIDGGLYLIKQGQAVRQPSEIRLIKNDPNYNEGWPRAVVSYRAIYDRDEPLALEPLANDGEGNRHLPEGTPHALVGSSSMYKRETYPNGVVKPGTVTATYAGGNKHGHGHDDPWRGLDAFTSHGNQMPLNFHNQGGDVGLYENSEIHALRILVMEPTTDRDRGPQSRSGFYSHGNERLRILGEIPVRNKDAPEDPDGNPDTSFLARIPADTAFTFQTLDRQGRMLNMSQTWHQLRPGEVRTNCGGCHAHSQPPTRFKDTAASKPDYKVWDLVASTPLLPEMKREPNPGASTVHNVEYFRDVQPILQRSCTACHTRTWEKPAGMLVLDADDEEIPYERFGKLPGSYYRLAADEKARFGHKPIGYPSWGYPNASRYIRKFQARRSLLVWKIFGERLDGFDNDVHPSETEPGSGVFTWKGEVVDTQKSRAKYDLDFLGTSMPPPKAVAGTYKGPNGERIRVPDLTATERLTILRWIDLGCPVELDRSPESRGWMMDDNRPVLTVTEPHAGENGLVKRILVGVYDYYTGLDRQTFSVRLNTRVQGKKADEELAGLFTRVNPGVWELKLDRPLPRLAEGRLQVEIADRQGNRTRIDRRFSVNPVTATR
jgi:hypothetical protein